MMIIMIFAVAAAVLAAVAMIKKPDSVYRDRPEERNPIEGKRVVFAENKNDPLNADGVRGSLHAVGEAAGSDSLYERIWKRTTDILFSFIGLIVLSPVFLLICMVILVCDPGPVIFVQKRIGRNKQYFKLHKFRTMKMSAPHDVPAHMLKDPDQYISGYGKILRRMGLDELPQIWDVFMGNMSFIGPRPALWNQDLLAAERDKWGANDIKPGLTGWAQVHGLNELAIPEKAKLDGEYAALLKRGGWKAFRMDCSCVLETFSLLICNDIKR